MVKTLDLQATPAPSSLYQQVLGEAADGLHPHVLALHCEPRDVQARGRMRVQRGTSFLGRLAGRLLGLPAGGTDVPTSLWITRQDQTEDWVREFDDRRQMRSWQRTGPNGTLVEQLGPLRLTFQLEVADGGLHFTQRACHLNVGRLQVPIASRFAPLVEAAARPAGDGVAVSVRVTSPLIGLLISYTGIVAIVECRR